MNSDRHCCLCSQRLTIKVQPRIMPHCYHSICTPCLKKAMEEALSYVVCSLCGQVQSLSACDFEQFPKNVALIKAIKLESASKSSEQASPQHNKIQEQKNTNLISAKMENMNEHIVLKNQSINQLLPPTTHFSNDNPKENISSTTETSLFRQNKSSQSLRDTIQSNSFNGQPEKKQLLQNEQLRIKPSSSRCQQHGRQLDILCLNDGVLVCSHCALFGNHVDHDFKTVKEVVQEIDHRKTKFQVLKEKKADILSRFTSPEFLKDVVERMHQQKNKLVSQTKKKFQQLYENVKLAEKAVFEDLIKTFKTLQQKLSKFIGKQNQTTRRLILWQKRGQLILQSASASKSFEQKAEHCLSRNFFVLLDQAPKLLSQATKRNEFSANAIQNLIKSIRLEENKSFMGSVFNYLNVTIQDDANTLDQCDYETIQPRLPLNVQCPPINLNQNHKKIRSESYVTPINFKSNTASNCSRESSNKQTFDHPITPQQPKRKVSVFEKYSSGDVRMSSGQNRTSISIERNCSQVVDAFINGNSDSLDLNNLNLSDDEIIQVLRKVSEARPVRTLKLVRNKLTNEGLNKVLELLPMVANMNLQFNQLGDDSIKLLLNNTDKIPMLRIANFTNNKINQCRAKVVVEELKRQHNLIVQV